MSYTSGSSQCESRLCHTMTLGTLSASNRLPLPFTCNVVITFTCLTGLLKGWEQYNISEVTLRTIVITFGILSLEHLPKGLQRGVEQVLSLGNGRSSS